MTPAAKKAFVARMAKARAAAKKKNPGFLPRKLFDRYNVVDARTGKVYNTGLQTLSGAKSKAKKRLGSCEINIVSQQTGSTVVSLKNPAKKARAIARPIGKANPRKKAKHGRRNPADDMAEAETMYEQFHGRPANRTIEHGDTHDYRSELAELGKLLELRCHTAGGKAKLEGFKNCQVTCTPDGTNIYFLGGDQALSLEALDIASDKDYLELGECSYIRYFTHKGFHDFAPVEYFHTFGEEDGIRPVLAYDSVNKKLFLIGGNYQCKPEGIVN